MEETLKSGDVEEHYIKAYAAAPAGITVISKITQIGSIHYITHIKCRECSTLLAHAAP